MTMHLDGIEFGTAGEAIQHTYASGWGVAIRLDGNNLVVREKDAARLQAQGFEFAYLCDHGGRIVTVPVN